MKFILACISLVFIIVGCSNDGGTDALIANGEKVTRFETQSTRLVTPLEIIYLSYNGNKLQEVNGSGSKIIFTYDGNLVKKTESFDNNILYETIVYNYANDVLQNRIIDTKRFNSLNKTTYSAGINGNINYIKTQINKITGAVYLQESGILIKSNGKIIRDEQNLLSGNVIYSANIYTYDYNNNPYKNITGFDKLNEISFSANNELSRTLTQTFVDQNNVTTTTSYINAFYEYKFNAQNYPTEIKFTEGGVLQGTTRLFYD